MKYWRKIQLNYVRHLHQKLKILLRELKDFWYKWRYIWCSWFGTLNIINISILSKLLKIILSIDEYNFQSETNINIYRETLHMVVYCVKAYTNIEKNESILNIKSGWISWSSYLPGKAWQFQLIKLQWATFRFKEFIININSKTNKQKRISQKCQLSGSLPNKLKRMTLKKKSWMTGCKASCGIYYCWGPNLEFS